MGRVGEQLPRCMQHRPGGAVRVEWRLHLEEERTWPVGPEVAEPALSPVKPPPQRMADVEQRGLVGRRACRRVGQGQRSKFGDVEHAAAIKRR